MVLSAVTAYYADIWGRKLGKQRKTIGRLRPKHTAVVIITTAGALIALFSFIVLLTADQGIRRALLHWDQTVAQMRALQTELTGVHEQLALETAQVSATRQQLEASKALIASAGARVVVAQKLVQKKQRELAHIQDESRKTTAILAKTHAELQKTNAQLDSAKVNLAKVQADFRRMNEIQGKDLKLFNIWTKEQTARQNRALQSTLYGNVAARAGDELGRMVVPRGISVHAARESLRRMLNDAGRVVQQRSKNVSFGGKAFVAIRDKTIYQTVNGQRTQVFVTGQKSLDLVAARLADPGTPPGGTVVRVVAMANTMGGETVPVDFELFENHVVFEKGQEIASIVIKASDGSPAVMNALTDALKEVRAKALNSGLIPAADGSVGSLPPYQLPDVYSEVKRAFREGQQTVRVRVMAAQDTWTSEELKLLFNVKRYTEGS